MPEPIPQEVSIRIGENGEIILEPEIRDLFRGEEVLWICTEPSWEVQFDNPETPTPFKSGAFGPGLNGFETRTLRNGAVNGTNGHKNGHALAHLDEETPPEEELPGFLTGRTRSNDETGEGDFVYTVNIENVGSRRGRVRIFRGPRPD